MKGGDEKQEGKVHEDVEGKGKGKATGRRKSVAPKKRKSIAPKAQKPAEESEDGQPVAGTLCFVGYMRVYVMACYRPLPCYEGLCEDDQTQEGRHRKQRRYRLYTTLRYLLSTLEDVDEPPKKAPKRAPSKRATDAAKKAQEREDAGLYTVISRTPSFSPPQ